MSSDIQFTFKYIFSSKDKQTNKNRINLIKQVILLLVARYRPLQCCRSNFPLLLKEIFCLVIGLQTGYILSSISVHIGKYYNIFLFEYVLIFIWDICSREVTFLSCLANTWKLLSAYLAFVHPAFLDFFITEFFISANSTLFLMAMYLKKGQLPSQSKELVPLE